MAPYPVDDTRYDRHYYAYLDTAETKAHQLVQADAGHYEACFLLAAAYGFEARVASDRHQWRRATVASRRALDYLQKSRNGGNLSAEFALAYGLFDYYAVWIWGRVPLAAARALLPEGQPGQRPNGATQR